MRVFEFAKKYELDINDILVVLKDRGVKKADAKLELSAGQTEMLEKRFRINRNELAAQNKKVVSKVATIPAKEMYVGELADLLGVVASHLILTLLRWGIAANKNQILKLDIVERVAVEYGATVEAVQAKEESNPNDVRESLILEENATDKRLPVIVVVGHVDHGKTTLLDRIRKASVALKEAGGITQQLGAYEVETKHGNIVFLDTPGHEAFSMMRERGVKVADVAVLVVAADDGVKPQTIECVKVIQQLKVPVIVAMNKIDKVDPTRLDVVKRELADQGLVCEEWGGDVPFLGISGKTGEGVDALLELLALQAEVLDLVTSLDVNARGYVLESKMEKGRGAVASILMHCGKLRVGDSFMCGKTQGKVSSLVDSTGKSLKEVGPSIPVLVAGFDVMPQAGDLFKVAHAGEIKAHKTESALQKQIVRTNIDSSIEAINIIIKANSDSSKEAVVKSLGKVVIDKAKPLRIIEASIGDITESNIEMAENANAVIFGFNVKLEKNASALKSSVVIKTFDIIYHLVDAAKEMVLKTKTPEYSRTVVGSGTVKAVFNIKGVGVVAGAGVQDGYFEKGLLMSVTRKNKMIAEGKIKSLQKDKHAATKVTKGVDCAFSIDGFEEWQVGDSLECFIKELIS